MCETIAGNTEESRRGAAIEPPPLTEVITSSIARSITVLPAVLPQMSMACMIGTPAADSEANVLDQRAMATFCTMSPIFIGTRSLNASQCGLPQLDRLKYRNEPIIKPTPNTSWYA